MLKKFGVVFSLFVVFASSASAQSANATAYIDGNLRPFFPEMHHQMALDRQSQPELCPIIAGTLAITPKAVRLLMFKNRRLGDELSTSADTGTVFPHINMYSRNCGAHFKIFRMENTSDGEQNITPSYDSGILGAHAIQVSDDKSIIEAAASLYLPTGSGEATGAEHRRSRCNEGLRGLLKADSLVA